MWKYKNTAVKDLQLYFNFNGDTVKADSAINPKNWTEFMWNRFFEP